MEPGRDVQADRGVGRRDEGRGPGAGAQQHVVGDAVAKGGGARAGNGEIGEGDCDVGGLDCGIHQKRGRSRRRR